MLLVNEITVILNIRCKVLETRNLKSSRCVSHREMCASFKDVNWYVRLSC